MVWVEAQEWDIADSNSILKIFFPTYIVYRLGFFLYVCFKVMIMMIGGLFDSVFSTAVSLLFFLTVVATVMVVILDNRNPFKTLVWVLVLIFLPVVGLILYFFFGQDTRKEKLISKKGFERLSKYPMMEFQEQESFPISKLESHSVVRFFQRINKALPFEGNGMDICSDGYTMIQSLLKAIDRAKHHIHIQPYSFLTSL